VTGKPSFRFGPIWLALPGVAFLLIFFLWPTLHILVSAIWGGDSGFSLKALLAVFTSPSYSRVMTTTFTVAIQVTVLCVLISYPLAYWLSRHSARRQRLMMMLILLPFWTSALVKNFAWLVLFGRNSSFAQLIMSMGGAGDRLLFNKTVVLFGIVHTLVPLCVIAMMPTLNQVNKSLLSAATTLGASPTQAFWRIFLPLSMRGVATAGLMIFITSLGFFITPSLLGSPRETMVGQLIIEQINELQNLQQGSAFGVILLAGRSSQWCCSTAYSVFRAWGAAVGNRSRTALFVASASGSPAASATSSTRWRAAIVIRFVDCRDPACWDCTVCS
jgi:putative spermidine/putrescine transport system permease protein